MDPLRILPHILQFEDLADVHSAGIKSSGDYMSLSWEGKVWITAVAYISPCIKPDKYVCNTPYTGDLYTCSSAVSLHLSHWTVGSSFPNRSRRAQITMDMKGWPVPQELRGLDKNMKKHVGKMAWWNFISLD